MQRDLECACCGIPLGAPVGLCDGCNESRIDCDPMDSWHCDGRGGHSCDGTACEEYPVRVSPGVVLKSQGRR